MDEKSANFVDFEVEFPNTHCIGMIPCEKVSKAVKDLKSSDEKWAYGSEDDDSSSETRVRESPDSSDESYEESSSC